MEARLTTMMGLASIAGSIVFGSILALATGTLRAPSASLRWFIVIVAVYLTACRSPAGLWRPFGACPARRYHTCPKGDPKSFLSTKSGTLIFADGSLVRSPSCSTIATRTTAK